MKTYDLYGYNYDTEMDNARRIVQSAIGIQLKSHESSYHCGQYYRNGLDGAEHFILQFNYDDLEKQWTEDEHQQFPILLYINGTDRAQDLELRLTATGRLSLVRREEL